MLAERITALITVIQSLPFFPPPPPFLSLHLCYGIIVFSCQFANASRKTNAPAVPGHMWPKNTSSASAHCSELRGNAAGRCGAPIRAVLKLRKLLSWFGVIWRRSAGCPLMGASARDTRVEAGGRARETNTCYCIQLHNGDHLVRDTFVQPGC